MCVCVCVCVCVGGKEGGKDEERGKQLAMIFFEEPMSIVLDFIIIMLYGCSRLLSVNQTVHKKSTHLYFSHTVQTQ